MEKQTESLQLVFGGADSIDLENLSVALDSTINVLKRIADSSLNKSDFCKFNVKSIDKGSIVFDIEIVKELAVGLLVPVGAAIVVKFIELLKIRKHTNGRVPKIEVDKVKGNATIINNEKKSIVVNIDTLNLYTRDNDTEKDLAHLSESLKKDNRSNLQVNVKGKEFEESITYSSDDLVKTSIAQDAESFIPDYNEFESKLNLRVKKPVFKGDAKWEFINLLDNSILNASVEDTNFIRRFHKNEIPLYPGTVLVVKMISREKESSGKTIHHIIKVEQTVNPKKEIQETFYGQI